MQLSGIINFISNNKYRVTLNKKALQFVLLNQILTDDKNFTGDYTFRGIHNE